MDDATRAAVAARAGYLCEYCRLHEDDDGFTFHVEHIVARKHGGRVKIAENGQFGGSQRVYKNLVNSLTSI